MVKISRRWGNYKPIDAEDERFRIGSEEESRH